MDLIGPLLSLLAPRRCAACDLTLLPDDGALCPGCAALVDRPPLAQRPPSPAAAAYVFGGPLAEVVRRFKYQGATHLGKTLAAMLAESALPFAGAVDRVVPIPLHPRRLRERGFNQSALLARPVARVLGVPLDVRSLSRVRETRVQAGLSREHRLANVAGAFVARPPSDGRHRVLLVDDVRTTGATLAAAALALRAAGFVEVKTLALACAEA